MKTEDAVGQVICHDITQIIKDVTKDAVFRKGHIIKEEDIPVLLSVGKDHIYVWENDETMMHENDAAEVLCSICKGDNMSRGGVKEGKIELVRTDDDSHASRRLSCKEGRQTRWHTHNPARYRKGKDGAGQSCFR